MAKFWIDFEGSVCIEAEDKETAYDLFWEQFYDVAVKMNKIEKEDE